MTDPHPSSDPSKPPQAVHPNDSMGFGSLPTLANDPEGGIRRDYLFYYQTVVIKAEDTLFCVPKNGLMAAGNYFPKLFLKLEAEAQSNPDTIVPGTSDDNPIILEGVSKDHFRDFLRLIYPFGICAPRKDDQWLGILQLATEWNCVGIRDTALTHLKHLFRSCNPTTSSTPHDPMRALSLCMKYKIGGYVIQQLEAIITSIRPLNRSAMTASGIDEATILSIMEMREQWHCGIIWGERGIKEEGRLFPKRLSARIIIERYLSTDSRFAGWITLTHLTGLNTGGEQDDRKREDEQLESAAKELEAEELRVVSTLKVDCTQEVNRVVEPREVEQDEPDSPTLEMEEEAKGLEREKEAETEARRLAKEAREKGRKMTKRERVRVRAEKKQKEKIEKGEKEKRLRELEPERELQRKLEEERMMEEKWLVADAEQQEMSTERFDSIEIQEVALSVVSAKEVVSGKKLKCEECKGKRLCKMCRCADKQKKKREKWFWDRHFWRELEEEEEAERLRNEEEELRQKEAEEQRQREEEEEEEEEEWLQQIEEELGQREEEEWLQRIEEEVKRQLEQMRREEQLRSWRPRMGTWWRNAREEQVEPPLVWDIGCP
ncbi:hypothetical protein BJ165DRAFT_1592375 [Panaeolus papilionaceus]|nr:hypothetical protein BJ165DRAFT_1592375 [Panaeolus papilionaceus]